MSLTGTIHSRPAVVRKAVADAREMRVDAVLTFPGVDLAGDVVRPAGLDFAEHRREPWNDLEHNGECVGWARESLGEPGGAYGVRWADLPLDGGTARLPVGSTWFDPSDRLSSQVFALCERDALPGVSLEFRPVAGFYKSLGRSPLEPRDAYEFHRAGVVRWTHCARPVNEGALTVTKSLGAADPLLSILSAGRVGGEQLHPTIVKSLSQYLPPKRATVRVEKAMPDTVYDAEAPEVADPNADAGGDPEGGATPTAQAAYDAGQMLSDACDQIEAALAKSEHVAGRKKLTALCDQLRKVSEKAVAIGDQVAADVGGDGDMDEDDEEPEVPPEDMEPDEEGVLKAFSRPVRKAYRPNVKRFTTAEVQKAVAADGQTTAADREKARAAKRLQKALARRG